MGLVEEPEVDVPSLRYSMVASDVVAPATARIEVLVMVWSDGSFTCATRPLSGAVRVWGPPSDMESRS